MTACWCPPGPGVRIGQLDHDLQAVGVLIQQPRERQDGHGRLPHLLGPRLERQQGSIVEIVGQPLQSHVRRLAQFLLAQLQLQPAIARPPQRPWAAGS